MVSAMLTKTYPAEQSATVWSIMASAVKRLLAIARIYHEEFLDAEAKAAECEGGRHRQAARRSGDNARDDAGT
jgi:hypothetical protein